MWLQQQNTVRSVPPWVHHNPAHSHAAAVNQGRCTSPLYVTPASEEQKMTRNSPAQIANLDPRNRKESFVNSAMLIMFNPQVVKCE